MKVSEIPVLDDIKNIIADMGIEELYPPQAKGVVPAVKGKNLVLAVPTASGKSLVAYIALVHFALKGEKGLYVVPLRALASEKYRDLRRFESAGIRVRVASGDLDARDPSPDEFDILIATSEKADSMFRHRPSIARRIKHVVADEVHLIHDGHRGPTLEFFLTRLMALNPKTQIIALSATIRNSEALADWLGAAHISSDWRPVELKEGIYFDGSISFSDGTVRDVEDGGKDAVERLVLNTIKDGGQAMVFVMSRRSAESVAERLGTAQKRAGLAASADEEGISLVDGEPSSIGERLEKCLKNGSAFHHAGLAAGQRDTVESGFLDGKIRCISATPTLAAGINLPARRVIIRDLHRFESSRGRYPIPLMEVKQMSGRAGRPGLDPYGEAVLIAKSPGEVEALTEHYLNGETENIDSKMSSQPVLKTHVLSSVASGIVETDSEILGLFGKTFYAHSSDAEYMKELVSDVLDMLEEEHMIEREGERYRATMYGKVVSDLYIDPESAARLRKALFAMKHMGGDVEDVAILHAVCTSTEMYGLYLRKSDGWIEDELNRTELLFEPPEDFFDYKELFMPEFKTALLLRDWISEIPEKEMEKLYGVGPGDIRSKVDTARWMLYAMARLSELFYPSAHDRIGALETRVQHGIRAELLPIISIKGVGRVIARRLYNAGYTSIDRIRIASPEELAKVERIGQVMAEKILRQVN